MVDALNNLCSVRYEEDGHMDKLKYLPVLRNVLWKNIDTIITHSLARAFLLMPSCEGPNIQPHVIISGHVNMARRMVAHKHIMRMFGKEDVGQSFESEGGYTSYNEFIEVDVDRLESKSTVHDLLKTLASYKDISMNGERRVIVVHNIDSMSQATMHSMRKILESYAKTAYFVMTCKSTSTIIDAIKSRCIIINAHIDTRKAAMMLLKESKRKDLVPHIDDIIEKANDDILNFCILMELKNPQTFKSTLIDFVEEALTEACQNTGYELELKIRDICTRISAACIPLPMFARLSIDFLIKSSPASAYKVTELAAEMEHLSVVSNKSLFATERFLYELVSLYQGLHALDG